MEIEPQPRLTETPEDEVEEPPGRTALPLPAGRLARLWWLVFVRGVVAFALGLTVLLSDARRPGLANFIGVCWLVGAALTLRWALTSRSRPGSNLALAAGVAGSVAAVATLARSLLSGWLSPEVFVNVLGVSILLVGVLRLSGAMHDDQVRGERPRLRHRLLIGVLDVGLGSVLLAALEGGHAGDCRLDTGRRDRASARCDRAAPTLPIPAAHIRGPGVKGRPGTTT